MPYRLKYLLCLALMGVSAVVCAQEFKKMRVGFGFGWASGIKDYPQTSTSGGALIYLEPSYRVKDNIAIGFRLEGVTDLSKLMGSYGVNSQYYFSNKPWRPFAGIGVGFIHAGLISGDTPYSGTYGSREEATTLMFYPRVGFDYGHFTITIDYTIATKAKALILPSGTINNPSPVPYYDYLNNSYLSIKGGINIGGGRKKKK